MRSWATVQARATSPVGATGLFDLEPENGMLLPFEGMAEEEGEDPDKPVMIGEIQADGQFSIVWKTPNAVPAENWSQFIPENANRRR